MKGLIAEWGYIIGMIAGLPLGAFVSIVLMGTGESGFEFLPNILIGAVVGMFSGLLAGVIAGAALRTKLEE